MTEPDSTPAKPLPLNSELVTSIGVGTTILPVSGWRVRWRRQPNGRAVVEIADDAEELVALIASGPLFGVDAAWRGTRRNAEGIRQWWALAIGHVTADTDTDTVVTFHRRAEPHRRRPTSLVHPPYRRGLWVAIASGLYTSVSVRQGTRHNVRRLLPPPTFGWTA